MRDQIELIRTLGSERRAVAGGQFWPKREHRPPREPGNITKKSRRTFAASRAGQWPAKRQGWKPAGPRPSNTSNLICKEMVSVYDSQVRAAEVSI